MLFRGRVGFKTFKYSTTKEKSIPTCDAHTPFTPRQTYRSKKTQTERKTITVNSIIEIAQCYFLRWPVQKLLSRHRKLTLVS